MDPQGPAWTRLNPGLGPVLDPLEPRIRTRLDPRPGATWTRTRLDPIEPAEP